MNFGRGARVITSRKSGNDLIVTFEGKNSGITPDEFAPKLIGRTRKGRLIYGYASLPYINYTPDILSASYPVCVTAKGKEFWEMQVRNLGLSDSPKTQVRLLQDDCVLAEGWVKILSPYEETFLQLPVCNKHLDISKPLQICFYVMERRLEKKRLLIDQGIKKVEVFASTFFMSDQKGFCYESWYWFQEQLLPLKERNVR